MKPIKVEYLWKDELGDTYSTEGEAQIPHDIKGDSDEAMIWIAERAAPLAVEGSTLVGCLYLDHVNEDEKMLEQATTEDESPPERLN